MRISSALSKVAQAPSYRWAWAASLCFFAAQFAPQIEASSPEQIHVAYTNAEDELLVQWASPV